MNILGLNILNKTTVKDIKKDSGGVISKDGKKIAVYRDKEGKLTMVSAKCTHKGCVVMWNDEEKTWDCPCHGSRFDKDGNVINGPAIKKLESVS